MVIRKICTDFNTDTISDFDLPGENSFVTNLYWFPNTIILEKLIQFCISKNFKKILEIGPGKTPFPLATTIVGFNETVKDYIDINIEHTPLPFEDQSFDFLYCRHVLEDINYPVFALKEMFRVSKWVYIETPSPMVEMSRNIDAERNNDMFNNYYNNLKLPTYEQLKQTITDAELPAKLVGFNSVSINSKPC